MIKPNSAAPPIGGPKPPPRKTDAELQAMSRISRILADLDTKQRVRIVAWLADRFNPTEPLTVVEEILKREA